MIRLRWLFIILIIQCLEIKPGAAAYATSHHGYLRRTKESDDDLKARRRRRLLLSSGFSHLSSAETKDGDFFSTSRKHYYNSARIHTLMSTSLHNNICNETIQDNIEKTVSDLSTRMADHPLTPKISSILLRWREEWKHQKDATGLLTKPNLLHEVEESMSALQLLLDWLDRQQPLLTANNNNSNLPPPSTSTSTSTPIAIVDVCCGKGVFSMLASYVFEDDSRISRIMMMDKDRNVNWSHINAANFDADIQNRPIIETRQCDLFEMDEIIEWMSNNNNQEKLGLVGIHLCKNLSPALVGIANSLGVDKVPFLCLAPCCLPRIVLQSNYRNEKTKKQQHKPNLLEVATYETPLQRQARLIADQQRKNARRRKTPCLLCKSTDHKIQQCPNLPTSKEIQLELFQKAAALEPCWKCGKLGHTKKDCLSQQKSSIPTKISRPIRTVDVSNVITTSDPFETYCEKLSTSIERDHVFIYKSKLERASSHNNQNQHGNNWNRNRKSIFIVAHQRRP